MSEVSMNNTAVVFIHGFTGAENTWVNRDGAHFSTFLESFSELSILDFYYFSYHTKIFSVTNNSAAKVVSGIVNKVLPSKFKLKSSVIKKNTPISEIAQELLTYLKYELAEYKNIIFICHSMGGLVAKNAIVNILENYASSDHNIIGYCSLATPHKGSIPSILMSPFNINAKEMAPLDINNVALNDKWISHSEKINKTLYVRAKSDEVVGISSSVPFSCVQRFPVAVVEADHTSICKPNQKTDIICKVIRQFLLDCLSFIKVSSITAENIEEHVSSYDKEIFVIKMVLANVEELLIDDAKESFFLAEIVEKQASKNERELIKELKLRIISAYRTVVGSSLEKSSSEIVGLIHEKIIDSDKQALDCAIKYLNFIHKKGFLHQHANQNNLDVNWEKKVTLKEISDYKGANHD